MDSSSTFIGDDNPEPDGQAAAAAACCTSASDLRTVALPSKKSSAPRAEIIGDSPKSVVLDPKHPGYNQIRRVTILDVDRDWTIEAVHGHALKQTTTSGEPDASAPVGETSTSGVTVYPHDADEVLRALDPSLHIETLYLRPDARQSLAAIRRRKHTTDVFINLYDRADETGQKIVDYMQNEGLAFTGAGSRFYDPTRMELKRLCRYSKIPTPPFAIVADARHVDAQLAEQLGGFPLFCKPEHGYDSVGIDENSLVHTVRALQVRVEKLIDEFGSALVERYVDGREFSVLVAGSKGNLHCFPPVEYKFPAGRQPGATVTATATPVTARAVGVPPVEPILTVASGLAASSASTPSPSPSASPLPSDRRGDDVVSPCPCVPEPSASPSPSDSSDGVNASTAAPSDATAPGTAPAPAPASGAAFITFDDKWGSSFENRWVLVNEDCEGALATQLMAHCRKLYEAFEGEGLCRFDLRLDAASGQLMVLDANPNCSTFYKDSCTADSIMSLVPGWSKVRFMRFLVDHALERQRAWHKTHAYVVKYGEEKGFSLHAARDLHEGELVYSDEEAPLRLVTRSHASRHWSAAEMSSFDAYAWPVGSGVFAIWDADSAKWKPINHSCDPSTWMDGLAVVARRALARDEELTLDYATFEPSHPAFECWCGADQCRRMIRPDEYREEWFKRRYGHHVSPHIRALQAREAHEEERERRHKEEMDKVRAGLM